MKRLHKTLLSCLLISGFVPACSSRRASAEPPRDGEPKPSEPAFFNQRIRPVLAEFCWKCHGEEKSKNGLRLDSRAALVQGGDSGAAIVAGKPEESLLVEAIRRSGDLQMPPDKQLPDAVVNDFVAWIRGGALWAADAAALDDRAATSHWAFRPINAMLPPPDVEGWSENPVDCFLRAKQRERRLSPAEAADRRTLIRRVTFDLIGLPPTPLEIENFLADRSLDAWERVLERLLASPRYGEHWGRHWLDVARYADSAGFEHDGVYRNAWRYRDYVIQAFNADKPFDRFIHEQLAGDELWPDNADALAASGLYCIGPVMEESAMTADQLEYEWLIDAADTTGTAFLGLTVGCARRHNHKYDPITQYDYFALQAVFAASDRPFSSKIRERRIKALNGLLSDRPLPDNLKDDLRCRIQSDERSDLHLFHRDEPMQIHRLHRGELGKPREIAEPAVPTALASAMINGTGERCDRVPSPNRTIPQTAEGASPCRSREPASRQMSTNDPTQSGKISPTTWGISAHRSRKSYC